jgi:hypothetical protein
MTAEQGGTMARSGQVAAIVLCAVTLLAAGDARAELFSKAYAFKPDTTLQVGAELAGGLRLDSVEFVVPPPDAARGALFSGPKVKVSISNLGTSSAKIGVAVAVTDADGRLVGVASGGTKLFPLRGGRQIVYTLGIDGVSAELENGTVFRISIEPAP